MPDGDSARARELTFGSGKQDRGFGLSWTPGGENNYQPSVSPDGKWVVYRSLGDELWALWKVD